MIIQNYGNNGISHQLQAYFVEWLVLYSCGPVHLKTETALNLNFRLTDLSGSRQTSNRTRAVLSYQSEYEMSSCSSLSDVRISVNTNTDGTGWRRLLGNTDTHMLVHHYSNQVCRNSVQSVKRPGSVVTDTTGTSWSLAKSIQWFHSYRCCSVSLTVVSRQSLYNVNMITTTRTSNQVIKY